MGDFVILAASESWLDLSFWLNILKAALGLGAVIFVHELGHFAIAKWCGVKCSEFYLGFKTPLNLKFFSFKWGETEYGIGILPLGGYVSMLGQNDDPAQQAAEYEKYMKGEGAQLDPGNYLAKTVPQRMAIISAGVIMNLIFAFIFSVWAYELGVTYMPCIVGAVSPGDPAWVADIRPGDEIVAVNGIDKPRFQQDLMQRVTLADLDHGVTLDIKRPGVPEPIAKVVKPQHNVVQQRPTIGLGYPKSLQVVVPKDGALLDNSFAKAEPAFQSQDKIISVAGKPVATWAEFERELMLHESEAVDVVIERKVPKAGSDAKSTASEVTIKLPPQPTKLLGLEMEMMPIAAIQESSPAYTAGLKVGDQIVSIDGQPVGDPLTLPDRIRKLAGKTVKLGITRGQQTLTIDVIPRDGLWYEGPLGEKGLVSVPPLGIAFGVANRIASVEPNSPAATAGMKAGESIVSAQLVYEGKQADRAKALKLDKPFTFVGDGENRIDWALFHESVLQRSLDGAKLKLTTESKESFDVTPLVSDQQFNVDRGVIANFEERTRQAASFGEAVALGWRETKEDVLLVYRFLQKLTSGQISVKLLRGPLTIGYVAHDRASAGFPQLLTFLAVLSANLAVVNFLPIPVLDGGHMVFLALEGLRGKPVSAKIQEWGTIAGLCFLACLMIFVFSMDIGDFWGR